MFYLIGLGLCDESDITLRGLNAIRSASRVYLEAYTSILMVSKERLENFYQKPLILADREMVESNADEILQGADKDDVALLVVGDPFGYVHIHRCREILMMMFISGQQRIQISSYAPGTSIFPLRSSTTRPSSPPLVLVAFSCITLARPFPSYSSHLLGAHPRSTTEYQKMPSWDYTPSCCWTSKSRNRAKKTWREEG